MKGSIEPAARRSDAGTYSASRRIGRPPRLRSENARPSLSFREIALASLLSGRDSERVLVDAIDDGIQLDQQTSATPDTK